MNRSLICLLLLFSMVVIANESVSEQPLGKTITNDCDLTELPALGNKFKLDGYLRIATRMQKIGKAEACNKLLILAANDKKGAIIVLCRMLFTEKTPAGFTAPGLGDAHCLGNTNPDDWPLLPIEIVDGVPFCVVRGYTFDGFPEPSSHYLEYCIKNCEWSTARFELATLEAKQKALTKLIASPRWKGRLKDSEKNFLLTQIK